MSAESEWLPTRIVSEMLCVEPNSMAVFDQRGYFDEMTRFRHSPQGWWLWRRDEVERVAHLRREGKLSVRAAVRVLLAEREGRV